MMDPQNMEILSSLAQCLLVGGKHEQALNCAEVVLRKVISISILTGVEKLHLTSLGLWFSHTYDKVWLFESDNFISIVIDC